MTLGLPAHRVSKLYYMVDSENFVNLIIIRHGRYYFFGG